MIAWIGFLVNFPGEAWTLAIFLFAGLAFLWGVWARQALLAIVLGSMLAGILLLDFAPVPSTSDWFTALALEALSGTALVGAGATVYTARQVLSIAPSRLTYRRLRRRLSGHDLMTTENAQLIERHCEVMAKVREAESLVEKLRADSEEFAQTRAAIEMRRRLKMTEVLLAKLLAHQNTIEDALTEFRVRRVAAAVLREVRDALGRGIRIRADDLRTWVSLARQEAAEAAAKPPVAKLKSTSAGHPTKLLDQTEKELLEYLAAYRLQDSSEQGWSQLDELEEALQRASAWDEVDNLAGDTWQRLEAEFTGVRAEVDGIIEAEKLRL